MTDVIRAVGRRHRAARSRLLLLAVGIVTGVLTGCSSGPSSQNAEGAATTSSSGDRTCVSASDGPEALVEAARTECRSTHFVLVDTYQDLPDDFMLRALMTPKDGNSSVLGYRIYSRDR